MNQKFTMKTDRSSSFSSSSSSSFSFLFYSSNLPRTFVSISQSHTAFTVSSPKMGKTKKISKQEKKTVQESTAILNLIASSETLFRIETAVLGGLKIKVW